MALRVIQGVEELKALVGLPLGTSEWLEISQERVDAFAAATPAFAATMAAAG